MNPPVLKRESQDVESVWSRDGRNSLEFPASFGAGNGEFLRQGMPSLQMSLALKIPTKSQFLGNELSGSREGLEPAWSGAGKRENS